MGEGIGEERKGKECWYLITLYFSLLRWLVSANISDWLSCNKTVFYDVRNNYDVGISGNVFCWHKLWKIKIMPIK